MPKFEATGYVIHRRQYRETSMLVDFFTSQYGRISAVAKGANGASKSDRKSLLQPLQFLSFDLVGRSQLKTLGLTEAIQNPCQIHGDALYSAFYLNELLMRSLPETEPMSLLFEQYQRSLNVLACLQKNSEGSRRRFDIEVTLRQFELMLLQELGYLPDFEASMDKQEPIEPSKFYEFMAQEGFYTSIQPNSQSIKGEDLLAIATDSYNDSSLKAAKRICRQALLPIIGDKPLKSRELFLAYTGKQSV